MVHTTFEVAFVIFFIKVILCEVKLHRQNAFGILGVIAYKNVLPYFVHFSKTRLLVLCKGIVHICNPMYMPSNMYITCSLLQEVGALHIADNA